MLSDTSGKTVYELVGNPASNSMCTSACQAIWPPVMAGGSIAVVHGHPVFTFTGDSQPGQANGQNVKDTWGQWLAMGSNSQPISASGTAPAGSTSSAPSSSGGGGGGYGY